MARRRHMQDRFPMPLPLLSAALAVFQLAVASQAGRRRSRLPHQFDATL
jgi:hypothetical protein